MNKTKSSSSNFWAELFPYHFPADYLFKKSQLILQMSLWFINYKNILRVGTNMSYLYSHLLI